MCLSSTEPSAAELLRKFTNWKKLKVRYPSSRRHVKNGYTRLPATTPPVVVVMNKGRRPFCSVGNWTRLKNKGPSASVEVRPVAWSVRRTKNGHKFSSLPGAGTTEKSRLAQTSRIRWRKNMLGELGKALPL